MKFVLSLKEPEIITLQWMTREYPLAWTRTRANAVILSNQKIPLQNIAKVYGVCRQTASIWLMSWETKGIYGLVDLPGRGRHPIFTEAQGVEVIEIVKDSPRSLNTALAEIKNLWDISLSKSGLKNLCRKA